MITAAYTCISIILSTHITKGHLTLASLYSKIFLKLAISQSRKNIILCTSVLNSVTCGHCLRKTGIYLCTELHPTGVTHIPLKRPIHVHHTWTPVAFTSATIFIPAYLGPKDLNYEFEHTLELLNHGLLIQNVP